MGLANGWPVFILLFLRIIYSAEGSVTAAPGIPECGFICIGESVSSSPCLTLTNTSCVCSNEHLYAAIQECVQARCTVLEAIASARFEANVCQRPQRSRKPDLFAILALEIPAFFCALLRLFSKWYTAAHFELDDYVMLVVTAIFVPFVVIGQIAGQTGFGVDIWTLDQETITYASKLFFVEESLYLAVIALTKVSVLFFYLRIFPNPSFRKACHYVMAWVIFSGLIFLVMQIFQCIPVEYAWEGWKGTYGPHMCVDVNALVFTAAGFGIAQDVVILALPLPLLARLQVSWRSKVEVMAMFSLGIFIIITSCIRLRSIVRFARSSNPTWDDTEVIIWSSLEGAVSVLVVSLPAVRVLIQRVSPKFLASIKTLRSSSDPSTTNNGSNVAGRRNHGPRSVDAPPALPRGQSSWLSQVHNLATQNRQDDIELDIRH